MSFITNFGRMIFNLIAFQVQSWHALVDQYSFALMGGVTFMVLALLILRRIVQPRRKVLITLVAGMLLTSWFFLRPRQATKASQDEIINRIGQGTPVLIEL